MSSGFSEEAAARQRSAADGEEEELLVELKGIERGSGRVDRGRSGPRELDLDILLAKSAREGMP